MEMGENYNVSDIGLSLSERYKNSVRKNSLCEGEKQKQMAVRSEAKEYISLII